MPFATFPSPLFLLCVCARKSIWWANRLNVFEFFSSIVWNSNPGFWEQMKPKSIWTNFFGGINIFLFKGSLFHSRFYVKHFLCSILPGIRNFTSLYICCRFGTVSCSAGVFWKQNGDILNCFLRFSTPWFSLYFLFSLLPKLLLPRHAAWPKQSFSFVCYFVHRFIYVHAENCISYIAEYWISSKTLLQFRS